MRIPSKLWSVIRCLLLLYCTVMLIQTYLLFDDYFTFRTQIDVRLKHQPPYFPTVTVCNLNAAVYSELTARSGSIYGDLDRFGIDLSKRSNLSISEFIHYCTFNGRDCDLFKDFALLSDGYFGSCFTYNFNQSITMFSSQSGPDQGLRLLLKRNNESSGARIVVHSKGHDAIPERFGQNAPSGSVTSFGVRTKVIRRLSAPYGVCDDSNLMDGSEYSQEGCYHQCHHWYILQVCKCVESRNSSSNNRVCDPKNPEIWDCLNKHKVKESSLLYSFDCHCPPACTEEIYKMSYSSTLLPPIITHCKDRGSKECTKYASANTTLVEVYSDRNHFEVLVEKAVYALPQLLSDVTRNVVFAAIIALVAMMLSSRARKDQRSTNTIEREERNALTKA